MTQLLAFSVPGNGGSIQIPLPQQVQNIVGLVSPIYGTPTYGSFIIGWALNVAFVGATVAALAYIMYGGWKWITSNGDAKNLEQARHVLIYAAVGLAVVLLSAFFVNTAAAFFCVPFLGWVPTACR